MKVVRKMPGLMGSKLKDAFSLDAGISASR